MFYSNLANPSFHENSHALFMCTHFVVTCVTITISGSETFVSSLFSYMIYMYIYIFVGVLDIHFVHI